jgi:6-phosphogluconolactonase (cycloisomerase 2 family)
MKHRQTRTVALVLVVALLPSLASGEALETESASSSGSFNPLIFVEAQFDLGLVKPSWVTVSPDGAHVYVASRAGNAVAIFGRNATAGVLTYQGSVRDGVGGVDGLDGASSVVVSPDGKHVYVAGLDDDAVAIFIRNATTGMLTYVDVVQDGVSGVDGLDGARSVVVSPNGAHVYVASVDEDALSGFIRNATTGALTYFGSFKDGGIVDDLDGAISVTLSPDGEYVYVAAMSDDAVTIFSRNATTGMLTYVGLVEDGVGGVDGLCRTWWVTVSPDGKHVYVTAYDDDGVHIFSRNATTGMLTYVGLVEDGVGGVDGLEEARSVAVSPDGAHVYVAAWADDAVTAFRRDGATGALAYLQMFRTAPGLEGAAGAAVSPDGKHVYVTGNDDDAVVGFERNKGTGALAYWDTDVDGAGSTDGLDGARAIVISPDGEHVYVAGFDDDAVAHFYRDASVGSICWQEMVQDGEGGVDGLDGPQALAISPDGNNVYVAGYNDDAVAVFTRTVSYPVGGELSYLGMMQDSVGGVDGLNGAYAVVVSPDGKHVYVAGYVDDAVAIFSRSAISGTLTYAGVVKDTDPLINGLDGANSLAISPDGNHVYVASRNEDALQVLLRNAGTGALYEIEVHRDGVGGVDGLAGARAVALSPDGSQVYVVGQYDHALAVFSRDATWGGLTFVGSHKDGVAGVNGLLGAMSIAVSPEGGNVYVGGYSDDGVAVFAKFRVYLPLVDLKCSDGVSSSEPLVRRTKQWPTFVQH